MAEVRALREAVRTAEAALRSPEPIHPAVVAPPPDHELRDDCRVNRLGLANAIRLVERVVAVAQWNERGRKLRRRYPNNRKAAPPITLPGQSY